MVRPKKMENPKTIPVQVEKEIYEEIMKHIPREISFADKVREWMVKELESINMEKNEFPLKKTDPLNLNELTNSPLAKIGKEEWSMDLFILNEEEITQIMDRIIKEGDFQVIKTLNPKATIINDKCMVAIKIKNNMTEEKSRLLKERYRQFKDDSPLEYRVPYGLD